MPDDDWNPWDGQPPEEPEKEPNPEQLDFDAELSRQARDAAMKRVAHHANPAWSLEALLAGYQCAEEMPGGFTTDHMKKLMPDDVVTHEERAFGPIMKILEADGVIAPTDEFWQTELVVAHRRPKRVWRPR